MKYDAVVVGGSFAGLSAAMQLTRTRRNILLIDAARPRNRFAEASHGFLGQDGVAPSEIRRRALEQLSHYPNFTLLEGEAESAERRLGGFRVGLADGRLVEAHVLVLAVGVSDTLPSIPGLAERWGRTVLHCPYCHGYEIGGGPIGMEMAQAHRRLGCAVTVVEDVHWDDATCSSTRGSSAAVSGELVVLSGMGM